MPIPAPITEAMELHAGERKTLDIDVKQANGVDRQDMTGWTVEWRMYRSAYSTDPPLLAKTVVPTSSLADAIKDRASVPLLAAETLGKYGTFYHELWRTDVESLLAYGPMELLP